MLGSAMASKRRSTYNTPGHAHELTFSTYRRSPLLLHDECATVFVQTLLTVCTELQYDLWAYVAMPEHVHVLVWPRERVYRVQEFRSALRKRSARIALRWLRTVGARELADLALPSGKYRFWQDGEGYDRNLFSNKAVWRSIDYIHANPVRKGLCASPRDWRWSSAAAYEGGAVEGVTLCPLPPYRPDDAVFRAYY
jgi:putative transposase